LIRTLLSPMILFWRNLSLFLKTKNHHEVIELLYDINQIPLNIDWKEIIFSGALLKKRH